CWNIVFCRHFTCMMAEAILFISVFFLFVLSFSVLGLLSLHPLPTRSLEKGYNPGKSHFPDSCRSCEWLPLVWCLRNRYTFAARDFSPRRGASDEHIRSGSVRSEQRSLGEKGLPPFGLR